MKTIGLIQNPRGCGEYKNQKLMIINGMTRIFLGFIEDIGVFGFFWLLLVSTKCADGNKTVAWMPALFFFLFASIYLIFGWLVGMLVCDLGVNPLKQSQIASNTTAGSL